MYNRKFIHLTSIFCFLLYSMNLGAQDTEEKKYVDKKYCNVQRMSSLSISLGASDKFIRNPENDFYKTPLGINVSGHLTLPIKLTPKFYLLFKTSFGGNKNPIEFQLGENSTHGTDLYSNLYMGLGLGKAFIWKPFDTKESFVTIRPFVNVVYFPFVDATKSDNLGIPRTNYLFDSNNNIRDKTNFTVVPEMRVTYHFKAYGCHSFSLGLYYSRGISSAFRGDIWLQDPAGEVITHTYEKPFTAYGISIGYSIFKRK